MNTPRRVQMLVAHFDGFRMPTLSDEQRAEMAHRGEGFEVVWSEHALLLLQRLPQQHLRLHVPSLLLEHHRELSHGA